MKSIPDVSSSNKMRSPRTKFKNVDEPSPENRKNIYLCMIFIIIYKRYKDIFQHVEINSAKYFAG